MAGQGMGMDRGRDEAWTRVMSHEDMDRARTWTGAPAEVFYNMYEDGEDFTSSMTQHIQSRFGEYDDPLEFDDME